MYRLRAALVLVVGLVLAAGMVLAGYWQLEVYRRQGAVAAAARAAEPAVPLESVVRAGSPVRDGYGRTVTVRGAYEGEHQVAIPLPDRTDTFRVVTLLRLDNGDAVAVLRGIVSETSAAPTPAGELTQTGVLLPSEGAADSPSDGAVGSVRIPQLAQRWPGPLVDGFVVLAAADAREQDLVPAAVPLPEGRGRLRNGAYAMQWWLFAAFAVVLAIRIARDLGRAAPVEDSESAATTHPDEGQAAQGAGQQRAGVDEDELDADR